MCSAERAIENFKYSTQASEESVEDWGIRIGRLKRALEKFGRHVPFEVYLQKWKTGTRAAFFTAKLREATMPDDYTRDPVVFDMQSFRAWYQQFLRKQRERDKDQNEPSVPSGCALCAIAVAISEQAVRALARSWRVRHCDAAASPRA